jgi:hypothetical protein
MRTSKRRRRSPLFNAVVLGLALESLGCGNDGNDAGDEPTTGNPTQCIRLCDEQSQAGCAAAPVSECRAACEAIFAGDDVECQQKTAASNDCQLRQADVCDRAACESDVLAAMQACTTDAVAP